MATINHPIVQSPATRPLLTRRQRTLRNQILVHLALLLGVVIMFIPLAWTLSTSLKSPAEVFIFPPKWIPSEIRWSNYAEAVVAIPFWRYLYNTTLITVLSIVGKVSSIMLVAFAFARLRWWGRDFMFILMLATMMLPPHVTLIPQFIIFRTYAPGTPTSLSAAGKML
jgi:ABC-type glycerol-3-phosphate transport system permease component